MVIIKGESQFKQCSKKRFYHLPIEIWYEILSRLSFESFLTSQYLCKASRGLFLDIQSNIDNDPSRVPLSGLLIVPFSFNNAQNLSYFNLKTKESIKMSLNSSYHDVVVSSGYEKGWLADLSFDFSPINLTRVHNPQKEGYYFSIHGGLLLITLIDGTCEVHNPVTKKKFDVPKSLILERIGFELHNEEERSGIIIQIDPKFCHRFLFIVIRFCVKLRYMEVYYPLRDSWNPFKLDLDNFLFSTTWWLKNYVAFFKDGVVSIYLS